MAIECEKMDEELRNNAVQVIESIWHGIVWDRVSSRRRMKIYDEYASKIRSAAHTGRFTHFYVNLCRKMDSSPYGEWAEQARTAIERIEKHNLDLDVLELIIAEYQYLILILRQKNEYNMENKDKNNTQQTLGD